MTMSNDRASPTNLADVYLFIIAGTLFVLLCFAAGSYQLIPNGSVVAETGTVSSSVIRLWTGAIWATGLITAGTGLVIWQRQSVSARTRRVAGIADVSIMCVLLLGTFAVPYAVLGA